MTWIYKQIFFLSMISATVSIRTNDMQLYSLRDDVINKRATAIKRTMTFHVRVEKCLEALALSYSLYSIFNILKPFFDSSDDYNQQVLRQIKSEARMRSIPEENTSTFDYVYDQVASAPSTVWCFFKSIPKDFMEVVLTGHLFKSLGSTIGNCLFISITNFAIQSSLNKVAHTHTIKWYIQTHAPYQRSIALTIKQIEEYENEHTAGTDRSIKEFSMVIAMCNLLLKDVESIVSYMVFRLPTLMPQYQKEALLIKELLLKYIQDWRLQMHSSLQEGNTKTTKLLLEQCLHEIDRFYAMFALYEKHLKHTSLVRRLLR